MITKAELEKLKQAPKAHAPLEQELIHTIEKLEEALRFCANPEGKHTDAVFEVSSDCPDGDYYREIIKKARAVLAEFEGEGKT